MAIMESQASANSSPCSPSGRNARRPKGILKNSFQSSPPPTAPANTTGAPQPPPLNHQASSERGVSPVTREEIKELTIANTQYNAGHRRSSSGGAGTVTRRASSFGPSAGAAAVDASPRLKWDEANLYLAEQERTSTMKITEPKTPYARHYEPSDDEDEDVPAMDVDVDRLDGVPRRRGLAEEEIPGLSLGEPEEELPQTERRPRAVHVDSEEDEHEVGMSAEDREKHRRFEEMRKKHYEMRDVAKFLGHSEELEDMDEDEDEGNDEQGGALPVPPVPVRVNGS